MSTESKEIDKNKIQLSRQHIGNLEFLNPNNVQFMGIINDLSVEDEYCPAKGLKGKLSLGFWIKIIENWRAIEDIMISIGHGLKSPYLKYISPSVPKVDYPFGDNTIFETKHITRIIKEIPNLERSGFYSNGYRIDLLDTHGQFYDNLLIDINHLQSLRNDFCHFRFDISKLEETKTLLDRYVLLMK